MFSFGDLYLDLVNRQNAFKLVIIEKVKQRGGKLNQKEIRWIEAETGFRVTTRPSREVAAAIIKKLTGHTISVKGRGNPGTLRQRDRDILICEKFALWKGSRSEFIGSMATIEGHYEGKEMLDTRTIERALQKGEQYMSEDIEKIRARLIFMSFVKQPNGHI